MFRSKTRLFTRIRHVTTKYPITRGMLAYAFIWPTSSIVQEYLEFGTTLGNANWARAARFSILGSLFMAPGWYAWMRCTAPLFPAKTLTTAVARALVDQVTYSPAALAFFFFGLSAMEKKPFRDCAEEVREKFWTTYKLGAVYWPSVQTLNFYLVPERNRTVFLSAASFMWTVYMAHVKDQGLKSEWRREKKLE